MNEAWEVAGVAAAGAAADPAEDTTVPAARLASVTVGAGVAGVAFAGECRAVCWACTAGGLAACLSAGCEAALAADLGAAFGAGLTALLAGAFGAGLGAVLAGALTAFLAATGLAACRADFALLAGAAGLLTGLSSP